MVVAVGRLPCAFWISNRMFWPSTKPASASALVAPSRPASAAGWVMNWKTPTVCVLVAGAGAGAIGALVLGVGVHAAPTSSMAK